MRGLNASTSARLPAGNRMYPMDEILNQELGKL
jgi:hypothetical protein